MERPLHIPYVVSEDNIDLICKMLDRDVEKRIGLKGLGSVPDLHSVAPRGDTPLDTVRDYSEGPFAEALRNVIVSIRQLRTGHGRVIAVTSAIPAAIGTQTSLLLGLWGSAGEEAFKQELMALENAIKQYGTQFTSLIAGISVGSEDLYRVSPTGIENKSGAGATPDALVSYIQQVRGAIAGTAASSAKVGHVDTWTAWVNGSNAAVIDAVDWLGMDGYPYYETTVSNGIANGASLFFESYNATVGVAKGKDVWVSTFVESIPSRQK